MLGWGGQEDVVEEKSNTSPKYLAWKGTLAWNKCVCSVMSDFLQPRGLESTRLLCPWDFLGKNTGVGCHFLLQGFFPIQGLNLHLLPWQVGSLPLSHLGSPRT